MGTLSEAILKREQKSISFEDIKRTCSPHQKVSFAYLDDAPEKPDDSFFFKGGATCCACLCTVHDVHTHSPTDIHHWVTILKNIDSKLSSKPHYIFHDSLGHHIHQLEGKLKMYKKSLSNWAADRRVVQNGMILQRHIASVQDCGMHTCCRIIMRHLNQPQYLNWIKKSPLNPDLSVCFLCYFDLLKK